MDYQTRHATSRVKVSSRKIPPSSPPTGGPAIRRSCIAARESDTEESGNSRARSLLPAKPLPLARGTRILAVAHYDNSLDNLTPAAPCGRAIRTGTNAIRLARLAVRRRHKYA